MGSGCPPVSECMGAMRVCIGSTLTKRRDCMMSQGLLRTFTRGLLTGRQRTLLGASTESMPALCSGVSTRLRPA